MRGYILHVYKRMEDEVVGDLGDSEANFDALRQESEREKERGSGGRAGEDARAREGK